MADEIRDGSIVRLKSGGAWFEDLRPFLNDDYYPFTPGTQRLNDAVIYVKDGQITHSGFIIQLSGNTIVKIRSKWGALGVIEHSPGTVPADYGNIVYYLRKRGTLLATSDADNKIQSLLDEFLGDENQMRLLLASTVDVATSIVRTFPQFVELQLYGDTAASELAQRILSANETQLLPLLVLSRSLHTPAVIQAIAQRLASLPETDQSAERALLADAFDSISAKYDVRRPQESTLKAKALLGKK
jgi:hypothetical protein